MKKVVFFSNLIVVSTILGMQNNVAEEGTRRSGNSVAVEDLSLSDGCKTWTPREWITKIIGMPRNKEDFNAPQNADGQTILMCATKYSDCKIMQQVLNAKDAQGDRLIDLNAKDINGNTALSIAMELGDIEKMCLLQKNGADIESANTELAREKLSKMIVKESKNFLGQLDKKLYALCNQRDSVGRTRLMLECVKGGNTKDVKQLLNIRHIDVNLQTNERCKRGKFKWEGFTALMFAVRFNNKEEVELLLNHPNVKDKIDVNIRDAEGYTALMDAVFNDNKEIAELLLDHPDIDVNIRDKKGKTALVHAAEWNRKEEVELLLNHPNVKDKIDVNLEYILGDRSISIDTLRKMPDKMWNLFTSMSRETHIRLLPPARATALSLAAGRGHEEVVKLLLNRPEIEVNACFPDCALANAVQGGHGEIVKLLLNHPGIDVYFATALDMIATSNGHTDIVELLRNHPKIKNETSDFHDVLISQACSSDEKIIESFLDQGVSVNEKDFLGYTMLMYAAEAGNVKAVEFLLDQPGIDINIRNDDEETALECAERAGRRGVRRLMLSKTGQSQQLNPFIEKIKTAPIDEIRRQFLDTVSQGDINRMDSLLDEKLVGVDTILNENRDTALIIASENGNLGAVRLLLSYEADLSLKDVNGDSALIRAAQKGCFDVVEELLHQNKISINSTNNFNKTALMAAAENGHLRVVKLLLKKGAKAFVKDNSDKTALDIVNEKISKLGEIQRADYEDIRNCLEKQNKPSDQSDVATDLSETSYDNWEVSTENQYEKDLKEWEKNSPKIYPKIQHLVKMIKIDPFRGPGKPEPLKGDLAGLYSRKVNKQDRLVYEVDGEKVILKSCKGHYEQGRR